MGSSQLTVNPVALTVTAVANSKDYDGTTNAKCGAGDLLGKSRRG